MANKPQKAKKTLYAVRNPTSWSERRDIPLTILAWLAIIFIGTMVLDHISRTLFMVTIAALLAYTLVPAVKLVGCFIPRFLAIGLVYLLVIGVFNLLVYYVLSTAVQQATPLIHILQKFLIPINHTAASPLLDVTKPFGITQEQVTQFGHQLTTQLEHLVGSIVPLIQSIFSYALDSIIIVVISIYFIIDGEKIITAIKKNAPISHQRKVIFFINTLQRIVGAYIRGQLLLSVIIGVLVGIGMLILQVPYAMLLGVLAFMLSFIPILGTFISGTACILIALTKGWIVALIVLGYFVVVHIIEGDIVGPRVVGKALGLHPLVSLLAVILGSELYGVSGILFAAPIVGVGKALLVAAWTEWKTNHPGQFPKNEEKSNVKKETKKKI